MPQIRRSAGQLSPPAVVDPVQVAPWRMHRCILSFPASFPIYYQWRQWADRRDAAARGAVLPPQVETKLPGGFDLVLLQIRMFNKKPLAAMVLDFSERYGNMWRRSILYAEKFFTSEPEYIKSILATNFTGFEKGPAFHAQMKSMLGIGVFHRAMTRPFFSKDRISHFDIFEKHTEDAFKQMKARFREGHAVDWQVRLVSRFTLDSATEFLFGQDVCSLSAGLPYPPISGISNAAAEAHPRTGSRAWPLLEMAGDKVQTHMEAIDAFIYPLLRSALEKKAAKGAQEKADADDDDATLLSHLVELTDDTQVLRDETLNILLAGRDTTAATLTFAVYKLAQNPHIFARLREEVLSKVGSARPPSYDDIRDMKYLRAVINETLRLYPPVTTTAPTTWPSKTPGGKPWYIPANTRVQYSVYVMHRREDLWGPDAHTFDPDRFLDERVQKYLTPNPFIFLPFNAGPRICLGQQFAYNEVSFMLVRLLQSVASITLALDADPACRPTADFAEAPRGAEEVMIATHFTLYAKNGLWVKMSEAGPAEAV
ncbi:cytochrome P450 [Amylocystis lapponica]|nr:cytochrome P450 [Amylocystis lapponica]